MRRRYDKLGILKGYSQLGVYEDWLMLKQDMLN